MLLNNEYCSVFTILYDISGKQKLYRCQDLSFIEKNKEHAMMIVFKLNWK